MTARPVVVTVEVPRCQGQSLTAREIDKIETAILADNLHTLVSACSSCLVQQTQVVVSTYTVTY